MNIRQVDLLEQDKKYIRKAEQKVEDLGRRIEKLRSQAVEPESMAMEWKLSIADLGRGLTTLKAQLSDLKRAGSDQWSNLQAATELQIWNMRAVIERLNVGSRTLLLRDEHKTPIYLVQRTDSGRWGLQQQGSDRAVKYFDRKREAVDFGRKYARGKRPSRLIVRRVDGTFEAVRHYR